MLPYYIPIVYLPLAIALTICLISVEVIFFNKKTAIKVMLIEKEICIRGCSVGITRPAMYPAAHPVAIHTVEVAIYLVNTNPHQIIEGIEDAENAISMDKPAPRIPYLGTKIENTSRKANISMAPIDIIFLCSPVLLKLDIALTVIQ